MENNIGPEILAAISKFHGIVTLPRKDTSNTFFKSKYADLASVLSAVLPHLSTCGLSLVQLPTVTDRGVCVTTILGHSSGQRIVATTETSVTPKTPQEYGSVVTYLRRYAVQAILCLAADDDDGEAATAPSRAPAQAAPKPAQAALAPAPVSPKLAARVRELRLALGWSTAQLASVARGNLGFELSSPNDDQLAELVSHLEEIEAANKGAL